MFLLGARIFLCFRDTRMVDRREVDPAQTELKPD